MGMTRMYTTSIQDEITVTLFLCTFSKNRLLPKKIIIIMNNKETQKCLERGMEEENTSADV